MHLIDLWDSSNHSDWLQALENYWNFVKTENLDVERRLFNLDPNEIQKMSVRLFYDFLLNDYFKWKFTAPNRYATTTSHLKKYIHENRMSELEDIHSKIFNFDKTDIACGLSIAKSIRGLGTAGASGLLALLYPEYFGTVDQFVIKALSEITILPENRQIRTMNPYDISTKNGTLLINIMKRKATELNILLNTEEWTPRKIDMILWTYGR